MSLAKEFASIGISSSICNLYAFYVESLEIVGLLGFSRGAAKLELQNFDGNE